MNFTAIDFETANKKQDSACAIGIVCVQESQIVHKEYHLIKPPYLGETWCFTKVHGLTYQDVEKALTFGELWPKIEDLFTNIDFVAAHNVSFDLGVLYALSRTYKLTIPSYRYRCSMDLAMKRLNMRTWNLADVCRRLNIPLNHHEALSDAEACAKILLHAEKINKWD